MSSLIIQNIARRQEENLAKKTFTDFFSEWKSHKDKFAINHYFNHLIKIQSEKEIYSLLIDSEYIELKKKYSGINYLKREFEIASNLFLKYKYMYKYLHVVFLNGLSSILDNSQYNSNCDFFSNFLQIDTLPKNRKNIGIEKVLRRIFTTESEEQSDLQTRLNYKFYLLGDWECNCKKNNNFFYRFEYSCVCGNYSGRGDIKLLNDKECPECNSKISYKKCSNCKTRVTLKTLKQIYNGEIELLDYSVPLYVFLEDNDKREYKIDLLNIPLMLFLKEENDSIHFSFPGYFLLRPIRSSFLDPLGMSESKSQFYAVGEDISYDKQRKFLNVLEAILGRTIRKRNSSYKDSLAILLRGITSSESKNIKVDSLSPRFISRLSRALGAYNEENNIPNFSSTNHLKPLVIESSENFGESIWVAENLSYTTNAISSIPNLHIISVEWKEGEKLNWQIGSINEEERSLLDNSGIIKLGNYVKKGDILVKKTVREFNEDPTLEEKLLIAIFGDGKEGFERDKSFLCPTGIEGRVVCVEVYLKEVDKKSKFRFPQSSLEALLNAHENIFTKNTNFFDSGVLGIINIVIQRNIALRIGDFLYNESGNKLLVSGTLKEIENYSRQNLKDYDFAIFKSSWERIRVPEESIDEKTENRVLLFRKANEEIAFLNHARSLGPYSLISQEPLRGKDVFGGQELKLNTLIHLLEKGVVKFLFELLHSHSDSVESRGTLYEALIKKGKFSIKDIKESNKNSFWSIGYTESQKLNNYLWYLKVLRINLILPKVAFGKLIYGILSDNDILQESNGEVKKPETLNYRTLKPEKDGLFCERIFGPIKDYECNCGKYRRKRYKGIKCDRCGVEIIEKKVRRKRVGHIKLVFPLIQKDLLKGELEPLSKATNLPIDTFDKILDCEYFVLIKSSDSTNKQVYILPREEIDDFSKHLNKGKIISSTGVMGFQFLIEFYLNKKDILYLNIKNIIFENLLVIPPDLRPLIKLSNGQFATSDLNDYYRRIIIKNNRLKRLIEINAPTQILINEYKSLQDSIDSFLGTKAELMTDDGRHLKNIMDCLLSSSQHFNIFKKAYDFSAITRVVVNPMLKIDTCEIPTSIAKEIFKPIIIHKVLKAGIKKTVKSAKKWIDRGSNIDTYLNQIFESHPIIIIFENDKKPHALALFPKLSTTSALRVSPDIFVKIGWEYLGSQVKILSPLLNESIEETKNKLLPSVQFEEDEINKTIDYKIDDLDKSSALIISSKGNLYRKVFSKVKETNQLDDLALGTIFNNLNL